MSNNMEEKNSMELEAAKIAMAMHPDRDYHMSCRREGHNMIMTIKEQPGGNIPAEPRLRQEDVPQDIADLANDDGCLDDLVREAKSHEASVINNRGFWKQLDYLLETKSANWNSIRRAIGMEDA